MTFMNLRGIRTAAPADIILVMPAGFYRESVEESYQGNQNFHMADFMGGQKEFKPVHWWQPRKDELTEVFGRASAPSDR